MNPDVRSLASGGGGMQKPGSSHRAHISSVLKARAAPDWLRVGQ